MSTDETRGPEPDAAADTVPLGAGARSGDPVTAPGADGAGAASTSIADEAAPLDDPTAAPAPPAAAAPPAIGAAAAGGPSPGEAPGERPRTRVTALVWGVVFLALAAAGWWWSSAPDRFARARESVEGWLLEADPASVTVAVVTALGALLLVAGVAGLARRAQRGLTRR